MAHLHIQNASGTAVIQWLIRLLVLLVVTPMACTRSDSQSKKRNSPPGETPAISVTDLKKRVNKDEEFFLVDVRTVPEFRAGHLEFTDALIDYRVLPDSLRLLPEDKEATIYCFCRSGRRSGITTRFLREQGYTNVFNVKGGIVAWVNAGYPVETGE